MSAAERLEQLREFVAENGRAPSRRTGDMEEKSLGEWIAKHKNADTPTGKTVRDLMNGGTGEAHEDSSLDDYRRFCAKHLRAPMAATGVEAEQRLWEWARDQLDPAVVEAIDEAKSRCKVGIDAMRCLVIDEDFSCVLHPAESTTFRRTVVTK